MFAPPENPDAVGQKDGRARWLHLRHCRVLPRGIPAVLKNALDYAYAAYNRKPATFLGYGSAGGARSVEQLRLVLAELQVVTLKQTVHVGYAEFIGMLMQDKTFAEPLS